MKLPKWIFGLIVGVLALIVSVGASKGAQQQRSADVPTDLSLKDWKSALLETKSSFSDKNLTMIAAGISYYASLAFFPAVAAAVAIAAFAISPAQIQDIVVGIERYLPKDMASLVTTQLENQVSADRGNIIVASVAILFSLISVAGAVDKLIKGLSIAYDTEENRGFIKLKLVSLAVALGGIFMAFIVIGLLAVNDTILTSIGLPSTIASVIIWLRWPLFIVLLSLILAALYRYGPDRPDARWQWVSWGAAAATIIWLIGTVLFFVYVQNFANFSDSYSIFAGIIILMMWLNLSALIVLVGAQVNHRLETKTSRANVLDRA